jgi:hypothetical protein
MGINDRMGHRDVVGTTPWGPSENDNLLVKGLGPDQKIKHDPNAKTNLARDGYEACGLVTDSQTFEDYPWYNSMPGNSIPSAD